MLCCSEIAKHFFSVLQVPLSRRVHRAALVGAELAGLEDFTCDDHHGQGALRTHPVVERCRLRRGSERRRVLRRVLRKCRPCLSFVHSSCVLPPSRTTEALLHGCPPKHSSQAASPKYMVALDLISCVRQGPGVTHLCKSLNVV